MIRTIQLIVLVCLSVFVTTSGAAQDETKKKYWKISTHLLFGPASWTPGSFDMLISYAVERHEIQAGYCHFVFMPDYWIGSDVSKQSNSGVGLGYRYYLVRLDRKLLPFAGTSIFYESGTVRHSSSPLDPIYKREALSVLAGIGVSYLIAKRVFGEFEVGLGASKKIVEPSQDSSGGAIFTRIGIGYRFN